MKGQILKLDRERGKQRKSSIGIISSTDKKKNKKTFERRRKIDGMHNRAQPSGHRRGGSNRGLGCDVLFLMQRDDRLRLSGGAEQAHPVPRSPKTAQASSRPVLLPRPAGRRLLVTLACFEIQAT